MFILRRAATRALSTGIHSQNLALQPRCITTLSNITIRSSRPATITPFLKRFASSNNHESETLRSEESLENRAIEEAERSSGQPLQPETTSAAEFDASDVQPVQGRGVHRNENQFVESSGQRYPRRERAGRVEQEETPPSKELWVANLFFDVTEEDLRREFSRFGTILDLRIVKDEQGMSRGFGYITFLDQTDATSAVEELHRQVFEGRRLTVAYRRPQSIDQINQQKNRLRQKPTGPPSKTLYIGNMSFDLSDQDLSKLFAGIKNVVDVRVAIDRRTGQPRGFAHADFTDIESAEIAFKQLNNKEVYGRSLKCDYSSPSSRVRERSDMS